MDQDGHKDWYYDEGNGKPWKYVIPMSARRTGNFDGNNQENKYALARSSSTCGSQKNPDMGRYTPMTDDRAIRQAHLEGKCHKKLFEGTEQVQSRKPNLKCFVCLNQIRSINRTLTSDSQKTPSQKNPSTLKLIDCDTPIGDSQKTPSQKKSSSLNLIDGDTPISYSDKTPSQKNSYSDGDSTSVSRTGEKSFTTPTLTDLENSVHYDCRLDKVLRVAVDYALPEELRP